MKAFKEFCEEHKLENHKTFAEQLYKAYKEGYEDGVEESNQWKMTPCGKIYGAGDEVDDE